jgi:DNA binding domain, excisionase family
MKKITFEMVPDTLGTILGEVRALKQEVSALSTQCKQMDTRKTPGMKEVYNTKQVASFLNMSVSSIYKMVHDDRIPYMKNSRKLFFYRDDIVKWMETYNDR